jgi:hypothetical protein
MHRYVLHGGKTPMEAYARVQATASWVMARIFHDNTTKEAYEMWARVERKMPAIWDAYSLWRQTGVSQVENVLNEMSAPAAA